MKAVEIVNRALNLGGILARTLDAESDEEGIDGLFWLNRCLGKKSITAAQLPYYGHLPVTGIPNQESYFIPNLVTADVITFELQGVRYSVRPEARNKYWGSARANNVSSLPYKWYWERVNGGMQIYVYFPPDKPYLFEITGKIGLPQNVDFDFEFNNFLDDFYQTLLMYETADSTCQFYKISLPPATAQELYRLRNEVKYMNPPDLSISKRSMLGNDAIISYGQINISPGWSPT